MTSASQSKRINEVLLSYWEGLKAGRAFPLESDVDPDAIEAIWDSCFLIMVEGSGAEASFRYIYLGEALIEAYGDDLTDKEVCEKLVYPGSMTLVHKFRDILKIKEPVMEDNEFTNKNGMLIKFRSCMCPLGKSDTQNVGYIVGGMKWKAF